MIREVYLSLGSNLGDREDFLISALKGISRIARTRIVDISNIYETEPVGYTQQERFLNMAALVRTKIEPISLLKELKAIEDSLGRTREIRWGPRNIDIDILLYEDMIVDLPELTIPHPRMRERAFVLIPLRDIIAGRNWVNADNIDALIDNCPDRNGVRLYKGLKGMRVW